MFNKPECPLIYNMNQCCTKIILNTPGQHLLFLWCTFIYKRAWVYGLKNLNNSPRLTRKLTAFHKILNRKQKFPIVWAPTNQDHQTPFIPATANYEKETDISKSQLPEWFGVCSHPVQPRYQYISVNNLLIGIQAWEPKVTELSLFRERFHCVHFCTLKTGEWSSLF